MEASEKIPIQVCIELHFVIFSYGSGEIRTHNLDNISQVRFQQQM